MSRRPEGPRTGHCGIPRRWPDPTADQESAWREKNSFMDTLRTAAIESVSRRRSASGIVRNLRAGAKFRSMNLALGMPQLARLTGSDSA
jgi:hypothetical protein